jgi:hypothetical protein
MSEIEHEIAHAVERVASTSQQRIRGLFRRPKMTGAPAPADAVLVTPPLPTKSVTTQAAPVPPPLPSFLLKPKVSKPMAQTPTTKAKSFAERLKAVHTQIDADMDAGISTLETIEQKAASLKDKLGGIVSQKNADLAALDDVLNQLTNGAPAGDETA